MPKYIDLDNDAILQIRLPRALRDSYTEYCKKNALNASASLRLYMIRTLEEYEKQRAANNNNNNE